MAQETTTLIRTLVRRRVRTSASELMPSWRKASTGRMDPQFFPSFMAKTESSASEKALAAAASLSPSCCECPPSRGGEGAARGAWCR
jgi:hypothetical protein